MSNNIETIGKIGTRLSEKHTYRAVVLAILLTGMFAYFSLRTAWKSNDKVIKAISEQTTSIQTLTYMVKAQYKGVLLQREAEQVYSYVFKTSMYDITKLAMLSISNNNIEDTLRQKYIFQNYTTSINNLYERDYNFLDKINCNDKSMSGVMDRIKPMIVRDKVLTIMFDPYRTHKEKRIDIEKYLTNQANKYTEMAKKYIR